MAQYDLMDVFLEYAVDDVRIGPNHISLFASLLKMSRTRGNKSPLFFFRKDIIPLCKLCGPSTYYKTIKELHQYGYISYTPSYNHFLGSMIQFDMKPNLFKCNSL